MLFKKLIARASERSRGSVSAERGCLYGKACGALPRRRYVWVAALLPAATALAWGPHSEITQAALDTLATNDALVVQLGAEAQRLTNYCWMGDFHRLVFEEQAELFYADDYLLFPGATPQWEHFGPWLKKTFRPYFQRALQALRTETPANAARWVGSLTHFVEDAGAPPHALGLRGGVHSALEWWVDTNAIHLSDYRPSLLGHTDDQALTGLIERLARLDEFAKKRGQAVRLQAELGNRGKVRPAVLECALETSRVAADVWHTLGVLAQTPTTNSAALRGTVSSTASPGMERFSAKIILEGTSYSTLADARGRYEFHGLPAGHYRVAALRAGGGLASAAVELAAGTTNVCDLALAQKAVSLFRNDDFKLRWVSTNAPDCWYPVKSSWESEFVPLREGQRYRLAANFRTNASAVVTVRWMERPERALPAFRLFPRIETTILSRAKNALVFTATKSKGVVQVIVKDAAPPETVLQDVVLEPLPDPSRSQSHKENPGQ
jgi:hypothetical protein